VDYLIHPATYGEQTPLELSHIFLKKGESSCTANSVTGNTFIHSKPCLLSTSVKRLQLAWPDGKTSGQVGASLASAQFFFVNFFSPNQNSRFKPPLDLPFFPFLVPI
jgi:hypothetical protein